jgi:hypothetical protein
MSKMKPWTKEEFEKFRNNVCADKHFDECNACARGEGKILKCFDDLTSEPYPPGSD